MYVFGKYNVFQILLKILKNIDKHYESIVNSCSHYLSDRQCIS